MFANLDPVILARAQFAFTVSFPFIFPAFSIGTASYLMVLEGWWLKTRSGVYANLYRYWLKIFAVALGMGVVSRVVMSYQFGTNWSVFSAKAGPVIGPLMAYGRVIYPTTLLHRDTPFLKRLGSGPIKPLAVTGVG